MKENKGITLIALIVTIIVLIILAGIAIAMLSGDNGVLKNADAARYDTAIASAAERVSLAQTTVKTSIATKVVQTASGENGYTATTSDSFQDLASIVTKELSAENKTTGTTPADPILEGYTVYNDILTPRTNDNPTGTGYIIATFSDNAFRSALPEASTDANSDAVKKGLTEGGTFISGSSKIYVDAYNPDEAILVYAIKVTNYGSELSKPVLTTVSNLKTALTAEGTGEDDASSLEVYEESDIGKKAWNVSTPTPTPSP